MSYYRSGLTVALALAACGPARNDGGTDQRRDAAGQRPPGLVAVPAEGVYNFLACRNGCGAADRSRAYAEGTLVLPPGPQGRFRVKILADGHGSFLGIEGAGRMAIRRDGGVIRFDLYRSADAGYEVTLHGGGDTIRGEGASTGFGTTPGEPRDSILVFRPGS